MVLCRVSSYWNLLTYDRIKDISTKGRNNPRNSRSFMVYRAVRSPAGIHGVQLLRRSVALDPRNRRTTERTFISRA